MATAWNSSIRAIYGISIHATHTGGDCCIEQLLVSSCNFNPRHPYGWRRYDIVEGKERKNISIHATHTGGDEALEQQASQYVISIHATHTGGDEALEQQASQYVISIHATHTGGDTLLNHLHFIRMKFQSTPPIRVATQGRSPM